MRYTPIFLIIGEPGHGKTEVAKILSKHLALRRGSTSDIIYGLYAAEMVAIPAGPTENPPTLIETEAYLRTIPKEEIRPELVRIGDAYTKGDVSKLVMTLVGRGCSIVDGVRRRNELNLAKIKLTSQGFHVRVWWVERHPAPPKITDNTTVTSADADLVVLNVYSNLLDLEKAVLGLLHL